MTQNPEPSPAPPDSLTYWTEGESSCNTRWEEAYNQFETPEEERKKFRQRLGWLEIDAIPRDAEIVEIFCGSGNGLRVLLELGFTHLTGVDLSPALLRQAPPEAERIVGNCLEMQFSDAGKDLFIVQGGLHHLPRIPEDLDLCFQGIHRALKPGGRLMIVEPWETPFLRLVHAVSRSNLVGKAFPKLRYFHTMVEEEQETYFNWLSKPESIIASLKKRFQVLRTKYSYGKWYVLAGKITSPSP